jgi:hypothetical protein
LPVKKKLSKKLTASLAKRKKLASEFRRARVGSSKRVRIVEKIKTLDAYIGPRRKAIADVERDALTARDRVKELRKYVAGYEADDGYNLREPKSLTKKQRARIEKDWQKLVPVLARPHVKARPRRTHEGEDLKALAEFAGIKKLPKRMKAIPVATPTPDKTRVRVDPSGEVKKQRGAVTERYYFFNRTEKKLIRDTGRVDEAVKLVLARMPAGVYFAVTGEAEAFQRSLEHDGPQSARKSDNLVMRQINRWIEFYPEDIEKWLRGFRWIGTAGDDDSGKRERKRILVARDKRQRERQERRRELAARAKSLAIHIVPKK